MTYLTSQPPVLSTKKSKQMLKKILLEGLKSPQTQHQVLVTALIQKHVPRGQPPRVTKGLFQGIARGPIPETIQGHDHAPEVTQGQVLEGIQNHDQETIMVTQGQGLENGQGHLIDAIQGLALEVHLDHFTDLGLGVATHIIEEEYIIIGQEAETEMIITMRNPGGTDLITTDLPVTSPIGFKAMVDMLAGGEVHLLEVVKGDTGKKKTTTGAENHLNHSVNRSER